MQRLSLALSFGMEVVKEMCGGGTGFIYIELIDCTDVDSRAPVVSCSL
jgi:hypothetical protein